MYYAEFNSKKIQTFLRHRLRKSPALGFMRACSLTDPILVSRE